MWENPEEPRTMTFEVTRGPEARPSGFSLLTAAMLGLSGLAGVNASAGIARANARRTRLAKSGRCPGCRKKTWDCRCS